MSELEITVAGRVLTVTFNRPEQHNAMTWAMYEGLVRACERADSDETIRVMVLRGSGKEAFVAGTDIKQFAEFRSGNDGVDYERRISVVIDRLSDVDVPTIAAIDGYCVGAGLGIACACDLRLATPRAVFGVPIARTLGNCLSAATLAPLTSYLGPSRITELLLTARMMPADEARSNGFLHEVTPDLDVALDALAERLIGHAPLSMWAAKETLRRLRRVGRVEDGDIISRVYGSEDFRAAVIAFSSKQCPIWTGH